MSQRMAMAEQLTRKLAELREVADMGATTVQQAGQNLDLNEGYVPSREQLAVLATQLEIKHSEIEHLIEQIMELPADEPMRRTGSMMEYPDNIDAL